MPDSETDVSLFYWVWTIDDVLPSSGFASYAIPDYWTTRVFVAKPV